MGFVLGEGPAEDEDVVQVDNGEIVQEIAEDVVHQVLEGGGRVREAEGHDPVLEVTVSGAERRLHLSPLAVNEVVARTGVELGENGS